MALTAPAHGSGAPVDVLLDAEKLDVYRLAVEFQAFVTPLLPKASAILRDQLERASVSIVLNIAEGAGRRCRGEKRRFYSIARGSATECAAAIDLVAARGLADGPLCRDARERVVRLVQMLTKLIRRFER
jgi:four helix bundle protein